MDSGTQRRTEYVLRNADAVLLLGFRLPPSNIPLRGGVGFFSAWGVGEPYARDLTFRPAAPRFLSSSALPPTRYAQASEFDCRKNPAALVGHSIEHCHVSCATEGRLRHWSRSDPNRHSSCKYVCRLL